MSTQQIAKTIDGEQISQGIPSLGMRYESDGLMMQYTPAAFDDAYYFRTDQDVMSLTYKPSMQHVAYNSDELTPLKTNAQSLHFHPANTSIYSSSQTGSLEFVSIGVDPALRLHLMDAMGVKGNDVRNMLNITGTTATWLAGSLRTFITSGGVGGRMLAESIVNIALAEAMHAIKGDRGYERLGAITAPGIARVKDYIEAHLHEDLSLNTLAGLAAMSPYHFARRFKETVGTAPHTYVMQRRSERAVQLLTGTHAPIAQIAYDCGFASQSHMTTVVKRFTGTTPAKIRGR